MTKYGTPSAFFKGLKEESLEPKPSSSIKNTTMLRCLRWVMKTHNMGIEVKRAEGLGALMRIKLVKYDKEGNPVDIGVDMSITDSRIEKGLFELEHKTMRYADIEPWSALDAVLDRLRKNRLSLPPHEDLRNEIIMKGHTVRIAYLGTETISGDDLYGGFLLLKNVTVARTEPQKRIGNVLDNLENALFAKERDNYRKGIGEFIIEFSKTNPAEG